MVQPAFWRVMDQDEGGVFAAEPGLVDELDSIKD